MSGREHRGKVWIRLIRQKLNVGQIHRLHSRCQSGAFGPITVIGSLVDSATCGAAYGKIYWQPASVAHYWQVAVDGSNNQRYTLPPLEGKVRLGVNYGYYGEALNDGTLVLPAITDVKLGVGYGEDGTEYEGELVAGGGGVPLIGPGGLVG